MSLFLIRVFSNFIRRQLNFPTIPSDDIYKYSHIKSYHDNCVGKQGTLEKHGRCFAAWYES